MIGNKNYFENCSGDKFEFDNKDPFRILKFFIQEYKCFRDKADSYKDNGEIEGALIYYSLASNSLYHSLMLQEGDSKLKLIAKKDAEWCGDICNKLAKKQSVVLSIIGDLQEELRKKKMKYEAMEKTGKNEDGEINCDSIFSKQVILKGEDCIYFEDVIGQDDAKEKIKNGFVWPNVYTNLFPKTSKGILLYGPPGTGKSLLAKATANELNIGSRYDQNLHILYFAPQGGDLKGKYVGETEKNIQTFFKCASEAASKCEKDKNELAKKNNQPETHRVLSIIFIDEVDAIARDRTTDESGMMALSVNALLQALDGIWSKPNVAVIAATNFPWELDSAFLRRFDQKIMIDLPNVSDIVRIIDDNISKFVSKIDRYVKSTCKKMLNGRQWYVRRKVLQIIFPDVPEELLQTKFQNLSENDMNETMKQATKLESVHAKELMETFFKLPENEQSLYYADEAPLAFSEYNRKTKNSKLRCGASCVREHVSDWRDSPYTDYIDGLTNETIKSIAVTMKQRNFSPSDINKLCSNVFRNVGERARKNASFYRMDYDMFCDKHCNLKDDNGNLIPKTLYSNVNVHISTLSLTKIMSQPKMCKKVSDKKCIVPIKIPDIKQIVLESVDDGIEVFTHKSFASKEILISDPNIEEFWINEKEFQDPDTMEVLFKLKVGIEKNLIENSEIVETTLTTQDFYVRSHISRRGLWEKWFTWESWDIIRRQSAEDLEKNYKKKRSTFSELIKNMSELIVVSREDDGTIKYYRNVLDVDSHFKFREGLSKKMLIFNYKYITGDGWEDEVELDMFNSTDYISYSANFRPANEEIEVVFVGKNGKDVYDDDEKIKKEELLLGDVNKETFFTFDLRDDDFLSELFKTPSSIRIEEYNELNEYKKDPSVYKKKKERREEE